MFDEIFWNNKYLNQDTGWDLKEASIPLKEYILQLVNKDIKILIPGCGNAYEASFLLKNGFKDITLIDIADEVVIPIKEKFKKNKEISVIQDNFFNHQGNYDLILEQTFFCALHPSLRNNYVLKMHNLLKPSGKLVGVLFNKEFNDKNNPPFGGDINEYKELFRDYFTFKTFTECYNSIKPRQGAELFVNISPKQ